LKTTKVNLSMGQVCKNTSYAKSDLDQHSNSVQLGNNDFKCDNCDKALRKKIDLNKNSNYVHLRIKDFKCDDCDNQKLLLQSTLML
jgi:Zn finger protein HypA/HybF involved in hydrogenase expression